MRYAVGLSVLVGVLAAAGAVFTLSKAEARASFDSPYTLEQTYATTLRMIRIDLGFKVTEKDPSSAYVLFEYHSTESGDRVTPGAVELVPVSNGVKVMVQLSQMPHYHEQVLVDNLSKKLRNEYGDPVQRPKPSSPPPPAASDAAAPDAAAPDGG